MDWSPRRRINCVILLPRPRESSKMSHGPRFCARALSTRSARFHDGRKKPISRTSFADSVGEVRDSRAVAAGFDPEPIALERVGRQRQPPAPFVSMEAPPVDLYSGSPQLTERAGDEFPITGIVAPRPERGDDLSAQRRIAGAARTVRSAYCPGQSPRESRPETSAPRRFHRRSERSDEAARPNSSGSVASASVIQVPVALDMNGMRGGAKLELPHELGELTQDRFHHARMKSMRNPQAVKFHSLVSQGFLEAGERGVRARDNTLVIAVNARQ